jgi:hypothetical protein
MIHPPTETQGPLQPHELCELADLLDDLDAFIASLAVVPEDLRIEIPWWALRLENTGARR